MRSLDFPTESDHWETGLGRAEEHTWSGALQPKIEIFTWTEAFAPHSALPLHAVRWVEHAVQTYATGDIVLALVLHRIARLLRHFLQVRQVEIDLRHSAVGARRLTPRSRRPCQD